MKLYKLSRIYKNLSHLINKLNFIFTIDLFINPRLILAENLEPPNDI
jgi:hypothetical protein